MRRLTMVRANNYVDTLITLNIYIEDSVAGDILINGIYCRKIGELANGERKTFEIEERSAKVFAIADNVCPDVCNEYFQLQEGTDHVFLSGQNMIHPTDGHMFRFDQNMNQHRKMSIKKKRTILAISIAAGLSLMCLFVVALWPKGSSGGRKTFVHGDMSITLTDEFEEVKVPGYVAAYMTEYIEVGAKRQGFYQHAQLRNHTAKEYAQGVMSQNGIKSSVVTKPGNITYFIYTDRNEEKGITYQFYCYVYKTTDAFWVIQFGVPLELVARYKEDIHEWATSVDFN